MSMKKLQLIIILLVLVACEHNPPNLPDCLTITSGFTPDNCSDNGSCSYEFYPDSKLEITEEEGYVSFEVKSGENLVFRFRFHKNDNPIIMDDEYEETILFEVRPSGNTFLITRDDLNKDGAIFGRMCFCPDGGYHRIGEGCIYGCKINSRTWNISLNLTAISEFSSYNRMKQKDFTRSNY